MVVLRPLDVIWIHDALIRPPGYKMWVCIEPQQNFFIALTQSRYGKLLFLWLKPFILFLSMTAS